MALKIGTRLGPYEITAPLGAGGMGEVYRATDTKLRRDVAIKVLPEEVSSDRERLARFKREAHVLASLNHPHIGSIYGLEESDGVSCLVLELVEGQTLAEKLAQGPLPVDTALQLGRQIASALEAAHKKGILHRDLKPVNIKVTPEGDAKVLDFGLAKTLAEESAEAAGDASQSPTVTRGETRAGVILGTPRYMSPEQVRGRPLDKRTDIWAFGVLLYECLTGKAPFRGPSTTDSLAAVLHKEPDWSALPATLSPAAVRVLRRCLTKECSRRLHDIADGRIEIEAALAGESSDDVPQLPQGAVSRRTFAVTATIALLLAATTVWLALRPAPEELETTVSLSVVDHHLQPVPASAHLHGPVLALSPDGSRLAFVGLKEGQSRLFVRELAGGASHALPGTEGAVAPFFSPDGQQVGFMAQGMIRTVALDGTPPRDVYPAPGLRGAGWTERGEIVFAASMDSNLSRVPATGGVAQPLTQLDLEAGEVNHRFPEPLPGGRHVLFLIRRKGNEPSRPLEWDVALLDLDGGERRIVAENLMHARYAGGLLLCTRPGGSIAAIAFDPRTGETSGAPVTVLGGVRANPLTMTSEFAVARNGTLAYIPGDAGAPLGRVVWIDRDGTITPALPERQRFTVPRLSRSGRYLTVGIASPGTDIWRYDLNRDPPTRLRLTRDELSVLSVWAPDERSICYSSGGSGRMQIYCRPADGSADPRLLQSSAHSQVATSWSSDGKLIAYMEHRPETGFDVWIKPLEGDGSPSLIAGGPYDEMEPSFSPDGRWIAYTSTESGAEEVYVQSVGGEGARHPVSVGGGANPVWRGDEIRYRRGDEMMVVDVVTEPEFTASPPVVLFDGLPQGLIPARTYDLEHTTERIVATLPDEQTQRPYHEVRIVTNWVDLQRSRITVHAGD